MRRENKEHAPLFFSVREVCKLLQIKPHILDYWEKRFPEIKPHKIGKRNFYKREQLELLIRIKKLLSEGYSLEGARKKIFSKPEETEKRVEFKGLFPHLEVDGKVEKVRSEEKMTAEKYRKILKELLRELKEIYNSF